MTIKRTMLTKEERMKTDLDFIQAPSTIPKREPVVLIQGNQQIVFNAVLENEKGFDFNDIPWSALSESVNKFIAGKGLK